MFRWVTDSHLATLPVFSNLLKDQKRSKHWDGSFVFSTSAGTQDSAPSDAASPLESSKSDGFFQVPHQAYPSAPQWLKILLPLLSALFFMSALFSVFAPAPLLFLFFRFGRRWGWWGALVGGVLVGLLAGGWSAGVYASFVIPIVVVMAELLIRKGSPEKAVVLTLLSICLMGGVMGLSYSKVHHINPWSVVTEEFRHGMDEVVQAIQQSGQSPWANVDEAEEWKKDLWMEMPSAMATLVLLVVWGNLMVLLRLNPGRVRESLGLDACFFDHWKAPEFLVWPTIVSGFFLLVEVKGVSVVAMNLFRFLMAIYAIQGLSVLSFYFRAWSIRRFYRGTGFFVAVFMMRPLLLVLGFFDLWFDFRSKIRQS